MGLINGGTAVNILARECVFLFDVRTPPGVDPFALLNGFYALAAEHDELMKARFPGTGVVVETRAATPGLAPEPGSPGLKA